MALAEICVFYLQNMQIAMSLADSNFIENHLRQLTENINTGG
jgi:hypothetical protein